MKLTTLFLKDTMPILNAKGGLDRTASVHTRNDKGEEQPGRTISMVPGYGALIEVEGFEPQLIPLSSIWYGRVAKGALKAGK